MPLPRQSVRAGQRLETIPYQAWNDSLRAIADLAERDALGHEPEGFDFADGTTILVQNNTGVDQVACAVLAVGAPIVSPAASLGEVIDEPNLAGTLPVGGDAVFAITQEPIPSGGLGRAKLAGLTWVQINLTDVTHGFGTPIAADATKLVSGANGGARILWITASVGIQWALVRFFDVEPAIVAVIVSVLYECLNGDLYKVTVTGGIVTNVTIAPACCASGSGGSGGDTGGPDTTIGFSLSCGYSIACLGLPGAVGDPYCLVYDGIVDGAQQWSYIATGVDIVVIRAGCFWHFVAVIAGITTSGSYLDPACGSLPPPIPVASNWIGAGANCNAYLAGICQSPSNYWCVKNNADATEACRVDSSLSPQPINVGESVTWSGGAGVVQSGPYATSTACAAAPCGDAHCGCAGSGATVDLHILDQGGGCPCASGTSATMTYGTNSRGTGYYVSVTICGGVMEVLWSCDSGTNIGTFSFWFNGVAAGSLSGSYSCNPLSAVISGTVFIGPCIGTVQFSVVGT